MFDMDLSAKLAQAALDSGGGAEAGLMLGTAKFRAGHHAEAEEVLARTTGLCVTDDEVASIASARAYNLGVYADPDAAAAVLDDALAVITDELPRLRLLGQAGDQPAVQPATTEGRADRGPAGARGPKMTEPTCQNDLRGLDRAGVPRPGR